VSVIATVIELLPVPTAAGTLIVAGPRADLVEDDRTAGAGADRVGEVIGGVVVEDD
jgi:hypothetical protein